MKRDELTNLSAVVTCQDNLTYRFRLLIQNIIIIQKGTVIFTLCFTCLCVLTVSQHASGVEVYEGVESVLLPCQLQSLLPDPIVVWSRFDLNPTTIHQHQDESEPYVQNQHYSSRTSMSADALDTGDFSLTLNKPRLSDSGNYTCTVHEGGYEERLTDVQLQVKGEEQTPTRGHCCRYMLCFSSGPSISTLPCSTLCTLCTCSCSSLNFTTVILAGST